MRFGALLLLLATALFLSTCDSGCDEIIGTATFDQTWFVQYMVENGSATDLVLRWGSEWGSSSQPLRVPPGTTKEILYYEEFLGPPPDAGRTFTCISAYRAGDSQLVFQLTPVKNSQWSFREHRKYHVQYTLKLNDSKLDLDGRANMCATLSGTAIDSVTTSNLVGFHVAFYDSITGQVMQTNSRDSAEYFLMWSGDIPHGRVYFSKAGYRRIRLTVPENMDYEGDRHYRMDAVLPPDTTR